MKLTKSQLKKIIQEELAYVREEEEEETAYTRSILPPGSPGEGMTFQKKTDTAKGAAMQLLETAEIMDEAPSHEPANLYGAEIKKQAKIIMDMLVAMGN